MIMSSTNDTLSSYNHFLYYLHLFCSSAVFLLVLLLLLFAVLKKQTRFKWVLYSLKWEILSIRSNDGYRSWKNNPIFYTLLLSCICSLVSNSKWTLRFLSQYRTFFVLLFLDDADFGMTKWTYKTTSLIATWIVCILSTGSAKWNVRFSN